MAVLSARKRSRATSPTLETIVAAAANAPTSVPKNAHASPFARSRKYTAMIPTSDQNANSA